MRRFVLATAMVGMAFGAQAADLPVLRGSFAPPVATRNWDGWYIGGQASYGSVTSEVPSTLNNDMLSTLVRPPGISPYNRPPLGGGHSIQAGFGAFAGYNSQWDDVVVGFEANYIHDGFKPRASGVGVVYLPDNVTVESVTNSNAVVKLSDFVSARVRGGYVIGCFLPYVFVGTGVGNQVIDRSVSASPPPIRGWMSDSSSRLVYGYSAGAGVDAMLTGGLFARAEYEYRRVTSNIESNINTVRLGLGYKF